MTIEELYEEFEELPDWDDRFDYLIDLGFELPELPAEAKTEENRVHGCQSNVWLVADVCESSPPTVQFLANSDSIIVNGLISVLLVLYSGKTPQQVISVDPQEAFEKLGLERHLSSQRRNGLYGMVERVRKLAIQVEANS
ncbi:MAG: SufE family protein [Planctomycetota bacterium]